MQQRPAAQQQRLDDGEDEGRRGGFDEEEEQDAPDRDEDVAVGQTEIGRRLEEVETFEKLPVIVNEVEYTRQEEGKVLEEYRKWLRKILETVEKIVKEGTTGKWRYRKKNPPLAGS